MSRRSAPFCSRHIDDPASKDGKKHAKVLLSTLQEDIASFRDECFRLIYGKFDMLSSGHQRCSHQQRDLLDRAKEFILPQICPDHRHYR